MTRANVDITTDSLSTLSQQNNYTTTNNNNNKDAQKDKKADEDEKGFRRVESVAGSNWCTMCLYNIPRSSLMITVPGLATVVAGAAMTAFRDPNNQSWTNGIALIAVVCLVVGGVGTVGGIIFWIIAWCRLKPDMPVKRPPAAATINKSNSLTITNASFDHHQQHTASPVLLTAVHDYSKTDVNGESLPHASNDVTNQSLDQPQAETVFTVS